MRTASRPQVDASVNRIVSALIARHCGDLSVPQSAAVHGFLVIPDNGTAPPDLVGG
jgi:hypothetical protein